MRILAVMDEKGYSAAPDVPTTVELACPGLVATTFFGLYAPAGTPKEIVTRSALRRRKFWPTLFFARELLRYLLTLPINRRPNPLASSSRPRGRNGMTSSR
jgi:hypothetical protein